MSKPIRNILATAALLASSIAAFSQGGTATLRGQVADPSGLVIGGATVQLVSSTTGVHYSTQTNSTGNYEISAIPPGSYALTVARDGFETATKPGVEVHAADNLSIDFAMKIGSAEQTITVESGAPLIDTSTSALGGLVDNHQLSDLPLNGRSYINLTLMQPGIVSVPNIVRTGANAGIWFSSNGATLRSNNFTLDGAILQDVNNGSTSSLSGNTLGLDGIQEYRVLTNSYMAEYGLAAGAQTVIVSRGGANQFHGSVFEYLRNSALDAANYFDKPVAANGFRRLPPFHRNNVGGSFGGPIKHDKTFFFLTFEALRESLGVTTVNNVPGAGCHGAAGATITQTACPQLTVSSLVIPSVIAPLLALYPTPNLPNNQNTYPYSQPDDEYFGQARVDHNFSSKDSLFGRYTIDDDDQVLAVTYQQFNNPRQDRHQYVTAGENHIFSPSLMNSAHGSYSRTSSQRISPTDLSGPEYSFVPGQVLGQTSVGGLTNSMGPSKSAPNTQTQDIYTLEDDVIYTRGTHSMRFGTLLNRYQQFGINQSGVTGSMTFASLTTFLQDKASSISAITPDSNLARTYRFYTLGFFGQDEWRASRRLTLNLGLRYEPTTQINEIHGISSSLIRPTQDAAYTVGKLFMNPTHHNFSPRLGIGWDVFGDGKTAVRLGAALMYDIANMGTGMLTLNSGEPPFSSTSTLSGSIAVTLPLTFPPSAIGKSGNETYQYNLKQVHFFMDNATVEQQLPFSMALSVSYASSRGIHLPSITEGNPNVATSFSADGSPFWSAAAVPANPNWGSVTVLGSMSDSYYHALQTSVVKRVSRGLQFQSSYTWSKIIDDTQGSATGDNTTTSVYRADPYSSRYDRSYSSLNMPQLWVFNALYSFPRPGFANSTLRTVAEGWGVNGIFTKHSGPPFSPVETTQRSRSGVAGGAAGNAGGIDRPNWNPAFKGNLILGSPTRWFDPSAFILQPAGTLGNVPRNALQGPSYANLDFSVRKDTPMEFLGTGGNLEFRADLFNIFNHPNFSVPSNAVFTGSTADMTEAPLNAVGSITSTISAARQVQLSLRVSW
jgi:hypothetical protein